MVDSPTKPVREWSFTITPASLYQHLGGDDGKTPVWDVVGGHHPPPGNYTVAIAANGPRRCDALWLEVANPRNRIKLAPTKCSQGIGIGDAALRPLLDQFASLNCWAPGDVPCRLI